MLQIHLLFQLTLQNYIVTKQSRTKILKRCEMGEWDEISRDKNLQTKRDKCEKMRDWNQARYWIINLVQHTRNVLHWLYSRQRLQARDIDVEGCNIVCAMNYNWRLNSVIQLGDSFWQLQLNWYHADHILSLSIRSSRDAVLSQLIFISQVMKYIWISHKYKLSKCYTAHNKFVRNETTYTNNLQRILSISRTCIYMHAIKLKLINTQAIKQAQ